MSHSLWFAHLCSIAVFTDVYVKKKSTNSVYGHNTKLCNTDNGSYTGEVWQPLL